MCGPRWYPLERTMSLLDQVEKYSPVWCFHPREDCFPCSIEFLLKGSTLKNKSDGSFSVPNPTQNDLLLNRADNYFIEVNSSQFGGMVDGSSPVYYAVQKGDNNTIVISYIALFAFQSGQTLNVGGFNIDVIINDYGKHQGDIERVSVILNASDNSLVQVNYEAHGDTKSYPPNEVLFEGTHPIVNFALGGHSCHNSFQKGLRVVDDDAKIFQVLSLMGDRTTGGKIWRPSKLLQLGLDANGQPINDQKWAAFSGRIGVHQVNKVNSATTIDGKGLGFWQWAYVKTLGSMLDVFDVFYQLEFVQGVGPEGPGGRPWVTSPMSV